MSITLVTLLGGMGVLPDGQPVTTTKGELRLSDQARTATAPSRETTQSRTAPQPTAPAAAATEIAPETADLPLPADSGAGERVVFDISDQRVWLVDDDGDVARTYLVSGSLTGNLRPGSYEVYSRSRWAVGIDDSGVMQYFVRFTRGVRAPIGFHTIPTKDGRALQTVEQLGTPQSHGCIRQSLADAKRLWAFAPEGTKVVVTA